MRTSEFLYAYCRCRLYVVCCVLVFELLVSLLNLLNMVGVVYSMAE